MAMVNKENWYDVFKIKEDLIGEELFKYLKKSILKFQIILVSMKLEL